MTSPQPHEPNFLFIGAAKCGSSSIRNLLAQHPDLFVPRGGDEINFFAVDEIYQQGFDWYLDLFQGAAGKTARGEWTNHYSMRDEFPHAAERIRQWLPNVRLIYAVRDPLPRIASLWMELRSHGGENAHHDFSTALRNNRDFLIGSTDYWGQLEPYLETWPRDRVQVIFFEDFKRSPAEQVEKCWRFLGLDASAGCDVAAGKAWQNPSAGKTHAPGWLSRLRRNALYSRFASRLPTAIRRRRRLLYREIATPEFSQQDREYVLNQIGDNCRKVLHAWGKPSDFWDLG